MPSVPAERDSECDMEDRIAYTKLQTVYEIRKGMNELECVRQRLVSDLEVSDAERRSLSEYRREMDLLLQEKMSHVEELRQIHADINAIEDVIKQSDECRRRSLVSARRLHCQYRPLKQHVDTLRVQLGLEPLSDITELQPQLPVNELLECESGDECSSVSYSRALLDQHPSSLAAAVVAARAANCQLPASLPPMSTSVAQLVSSSHHHHHHHQQGGTSKSPHHLVQQSSTAPPPPPPPAPTSSAASPTTFRQQPPPMKSCLSCHQQIHRNAPICPLCKAKSRSRNPKKPKKKD